jgi:hypothetical protein
MTDSVGEPYSILAIQPEWVLEDEAMGSKQKFWFRESNDSPDWLFKYPQPNTGQHWAEKIAAEVAGCLDILHARVELAMFQEVQGSATESFAREGRELFHGNQVLAGKMLGYDSARKFRQSDHTLLNIFSALDQVFKSAEAARVAKERMAAYLVLDALVGNTDRHHENWGILRKRTPNGWAGMVAPSFDHASSLGRELRDEGTSKSRQRILAEGRIGLYAEKAPGAIYWEPSDGRGVSPLELVRRAHKMYLETFAHALQPLDTLDKESLRGVVDRVPVGWMSETSRSFAVELMCYNLQQLRKIAL